LGIDFGHEESVSIPDPFCTCFNPDAAFSIVKLSSKDEKHPRSPRLPPPAQYDRICIELKGQHVPKQRQWAANRLVSAISGLFASVHHTADSDLAPYQIPKEIMNGGEIRVEVLEELENLTGELVISPIGNRARSFMVISDSEVASIFYLLPFVLNNEDLFNACSFFRSCCSEYNLPSGGAVRDVLYEPKQQPSNETDRLALENVVLQAFRTIEAVVGEPGKDQRFRQRLQSWGLTYDKRVGFPGHRKQKLGDRIYWLRDARDSAAAHGKRRRANPFTMVEAMEAQHLASTVLDHALWSTAEAIGRRGTETEIAFLLQEMYPTLVDVASGWATDKRLFQGKSAVDLARCPGGLRRVVKRHKLLIRDIAKDGPVPMARGQQK
jgi:hypothetical protein